MRIFALSDIHIDHSENRDWLTSLSTHDYTNDILILAGDISDLLEHIDLAFSELKARFKDVHFVPGNHDLWIRRNSCQDSIAAFDKIMNMARDNGIITEPKSYGALSIVPLLGWYDFSFGKPSDDLKFMWVDFVACKWPLSFEQATSKEQAITDYFISMNERHLNITNTTIISYSHFMPRIDIMPVFIPAERRKLYPVLGSIQLEKQVRALNSHIHVYGHSHLNLHIRSDNTTYINNAFGYPYEAHISMKDLRCVFEL